jgi:hypothetical protein
MSEHFERWKELAALCLREQDSAKLAELASEMNQVMAKRSQTDSRRGDLETTSEEVTRVP